MNTQLFRMKAILLTLVLTIGLFNTTFASQAGKEFNDSKEELTKTYEKVLAKIDNEEDKALLIKAQEAWTKYLDATVAFHARYFPTSKGGLFVATDMIQSRKKELELLLTEDADEEHKQPLHQETK